MPSNADVIIEFCAAWSRLDPVELASYFTEDGVYHNMPAAPIQGRDEVEKFIRGFTASWTKTTWDVLNVMENGDVVIAERLDRTEAGEKHVDLPCTGVFEMRDGKIAVWRDYFDMATYGRGMG